jgi:hypothetical protein
METLVKPKKEQNTIFFKKSRPRKLKKNNTYDVNFITNISELNIEGVIKTDEEIIKGRISNDDVIESNFKGEIYHSNYLQYLNQAYKNDYGVEVKPDHIWYTILCEISRIINKKPETYRKYFTNSDNKKTIEVYKQENTWLLPVDVVSDLLLKSIPTDINKEDIISQFSTTTIDSTFAFNCVFLESMSSYYIYDMYGCGFKKINIYGNKSDYEKMINSLKNISGVISELKYYTDNCITVVKDIIKNWDVKEFWENILTSKRAYLSDVFDGWITRLYDIDPPKSGDYDYLKQFKIDKGYFERQFPSHITKVSYNVLHPTTKNVMFKMILYSGILNSTIEKDCMIPHFNYFLTTDVIKNNKVIKLGI